MHTTSRWIVLSLVLGGLSSFAQAPCSLNCPEHRTISVNGTAQITADADLAVVRVGYKLFAPDAKSAYDHATDVSNTIMSALTASGIEKSAIESTSQVLQHTAPYDLQQYPIHDEEREHRQFTVTQSWTIRVKPDKASGALDTAIGAGANESGWIQWIVEDPSTLQAKASAEAVAKARKIAEQIAAKSDVHLGHLVSITEERGPMQYNGAINGAMGAMFGMGDAITLAGSNPGMNQQLAINSRRVEFRATVFAVFAIEDTGTPAK